MSIIVRLATINAISASAIAGRRQITMDRSFHGRLTPNKFRLRLRRVTGARNLSRQIC
jgi:hypothetical protein